MANGQRVYYRSKVDLDILARELLGEDHLYFQHGIQLDDGACVVDVGANLGFFLLSLNRLLKSGRVLAFEPLPEIFEALEQNAKIHNHLDVKLFACGLSNRNGQATFTYFPRTSVASTMVPDLSAEFRRNSRRFVRHEVMARSRLLQRLSAMFPEQFSEWFWFPLTESLRRYYQATQEITCQLRTLSDVIDEEGLERIDLLKVDTEGAEEDVLAGLRDEHWPLVHQAVVEVHQGRESLVRMEGLLQQRGFRTASQPVMPGVDHLHVVFALRT